MTLLVGASTPTTHNGSAGFDQGWYYFGNDGYVATQTGTATSLRCWITHAFASTAIRMGIYNSSGTLLAQGELTTLTVGAWNVVAIPDTPITAGQTYYIVCQSNDALEVADSTVTWMLDATARTYQALPSTITAPGDGDRNAGVPSFWADGTTGAGGRTANVNVTEDEDSVSSSANVASTANVGVTEDEDKLTASASSTAGRTADLAVSEDEDTIVASATTPVIRVAAVAVTDDEDSVTAGAYTWKQFWLTWTDAGTDEGYRVKWGNVAGGPYPNSTDVGTNVLEAFIWIDNTVPTYWVVVALVGGVEQTPSAEQTIPANVRLAQAAVTEDEDTIAASATGVTPGRTATVAVTEDEDRVSSSAAVASNANINVSDDEDTLDASANVGALPGRTASVAVAEDEDTLAASATVSALPGRTANVGVTEDEDTLAASASGAAVARGYLHPVSWEAGRGYVHPVSWGPLGVQDVQTSAIALLRPIVATDTVIASAEAEGDSDIIVSNTYLIGTFSSAVALLRTIVSAPLAADLTRSAVALLRPIVTQSSVPVADVVTSAVALLRPIVQAEVLQGHVRSGVALLRVVALADGAFGALIDLTALYATLEDMRRAFGEAELVQLTDRHAPRTGLVDVAVLDRALISADTIIDSYLASRYAVPLAAPIPRVIVDLACDIARYRLYDQAPPAVVTRRYERALDRLRDYQAGRAKIPGLKGTGATIQIQSGGKAFSRDDGGFV